MLCMQKPVSAAPCTEENNGDYSAASLSESSCLHSLGEELRAGLEPIVTSFQIDVKLYTRSWIQRVFSVDACGLHAGVSGTRFGIVYLGLCKEV